MNNHNPSQIRKKLYQNAMVNKVPICGTFELTPRCNMNCRMCYVHLTEDEMKETGKELTAQEWIQIGQECRDAGMLFLLLTGGEPFLRKDFKEIYTKLSSMGFVLTINTNGTMISGETVEWLKKRPPSKINITLYGATNETYDKLCENKQGLEQAKQAVDLLIKAGIPVGLNVTFTKDNIKDLDRIYAFAKERKLPVKETVYLFPPVSNNKTERIQNLRLSPKEAGQALFDSKRLQMSEENFYFFTKCMKAKMESEKTGKTEKEDTGCMAGKASFWITWDGKIKLCGMMKEQMVDLLQQDFITSWRKLCNTAQTLTLPDACVTCKMRPYCTVCGAVAKAEGIDDNAKIPQYLCHITENYIHKCLQYFEHLEITSDKYVACEIEK